MRNFMIFLLCLGILTTTDIAHAAKRNKRSGSLNAVCTSALPVENFLIKAEASNHINRGDLRTTGFSLICGKECVEFPANFYYCDGTPAAAFGYYGKWSRSHGGNGKSRAYGASGGVPQHFVNKIRAQARRMPCGRNLYLQINRPTASNPIPECRYWDANSSRVGSPW